MRKELLFAAIAPNTGINKWTDRLMYCADAMYGMMISVPLAYSTVKMRIVRSAE